MVASIELPIRDQGDATPFALSAVSETQTVAPKPVNARRLPRDRSKLSAKTETTVTLREPEDSIGDLDIAPDIIEGARLNEKVALDVPRSLRMVAI